MSVIQTAEFWTSFAFLLVVFFASRPALRYLRQWAGRQAEQIQTRQQAARDVLKKAEALKKQYEQAYQNRQTERRQAMDNADIEVSFLENEAQQLATDRMARKTQEVDLRLKMIEENGRQDIKSKMLSRVVSNAKNQLQALRDSEENIENSDALVQQAFAALDRYAGALKK